MKKIIRMMDSKHRINIPEAIRQELGIHRNDIISFQIRGDEVVMRREQLCDGCEDVALNEAVDKVVASDLQAVLSEFTTEEMLDAVGFLLNALVDRSRPN